MHWKTISEARHVVIQFRRWTRSGLFKAKDGCVNEDVPRQGGGECDEEEERYLSLVQPGSGCHFVRDPKRRPAIEGLTWPNFSGLEVAKTGKEGSGAGNSGGCFAGTTRTRTVPGIKSDLIILCFIPGESEWHPPSAARDSPQRSREKLFKDRRHRLSSATHGSLVPWPVSLSSNFRNFVPTP